MNTTQTSFTIQEAAEQTGLTVHTLRYYERIGLVMPVGRAANGHRRYSQQDIYLIQTLYCWLQTGMPLVDIQSYVKLMQEGDSTVRERRALLEAHRQTLVSQIDKLQATLQLIDFKIQRCDEIEQNLQKEGVLS
jgi:DNA-binding transcriptional MerR regulator